MPRWKTELGCARNGVQRPRYNLLDVTARSVSVWGMGSPGDLRCSLMQHEVGVGEAGRWGVFACSVAGLLEGPLAHLGFHTILYAWLKGANSSRLSLHSCCSHVSDLSFVCVQELLPSNEKAGSCQKYLQTFKDITNGF